MNDIRETYTIRFTPKRYRVKQQTNIATSLPYWLIQDADAETDVGFACTENDAKCIVLALDYMHAVLAGDIQAQREITRALEKLRN